MLNLEEKYDRGLHGLDQLTWNDPTSKNFWHGNPVSFQKREQIKSIKKQKRIKKNELLLLDYVLLKIILCKDSI